ncbi:MAG: biotin/lipoyl-binding protein [Planctomycetales bacterium]|nr:biotin/lipoyl-binding protein [Planctomycetales bacterium]
MAIEIKVPDLGEGIESGDVLNVLVREGDRIAAEQGIVELETDKAVAEVPSPQAGRVVKIHVQNGQTVSEGTALITLEPASTSTAQTVVEKPSPTEAPPPAEAVAEPVAEAAPVEPVRPAAAAAPAATPPAGPAADLPVAAAGGEDSRIAAAGPSIRRLAREVGIDLSQVTGSGPQGRITREDVLAAVRFAAQGAGSGAAAEPSAAATPAARTEETVVPAGESGSDAWGAIITDRVTKIRATIAANMARSKATAPHVTNFDDADITELEEIRQSSKADYAQMGIKLTTLPFLLKAVALSLKRHPVINAALDLENGQIIYKQYVNLGVAVDTPRGLMVPVIQHADQMRIPAIAGALADIAEQARTSKITVDQMRGGTFTISNLGAIGGTYSTPVINVPEVAILLVGRARKVPVVVGDQILPRLMMPLSLSYDHRLVDGAAAARFLNDVKGYLEAPGRLLLAP